MNSRERLEIVAQFVETLAPPMGPSDAVALRELDQLLADAYHIIHTGQFNPSLGLWAARAAQAGYGDGRTDG